MESVWESFKQWCSNVTIAIKSSLAKKSHQRKLYKMHYEQEKLKHLPALAKAKAQADSKRKIESYKSQSQKKVPSFILPTMELDNKKGKKEDYKLPRFEL